MALLCLCLLAAPLRAAEPELRGQYKNWTTYRYAETTGPVCYAMTRAAGTTDAKGKKIKPKSRGQVLLQVTLRPAEGSGMTVSYVAGQGMKSGTVVTGQTDKGKFTLVPSGDSAWTKSSSDDARVLQLLRAGKWLNITHTDKRGNVVVDTFSLAGTTAALGAVTACQ
jgi:hypothetical protein